MPRISALSRELLLDYEDLWRLSEATYGFVPNSFLTLARRPALLDVASRLGRVVMQEEGLTSIELRWLVAHITSRAAECRYCSAHSGHFGDALGGIPQSKLDAIPDFETSSLFSGAERAALRVGFRAGLVPNQVTDQDMEELKRHFSEDAIVEIVAVIGLFGFFNRWNDTISTELEAFPLRYEQAHLSDITSTELT